MRLYKETALAIFFMLGFSFAHAGEMTKTVEAVNLEKTTLKDQMVTVHGTVTKANNGIMKRNFVHIEDGSGEGESASLIITSQDTAVPGDHVIVTGKVALDTDFGFGYLYPLLVEEASIKQSGAKLAPHSDDDHDH